MPHEFVSTVEAADHFRVSRETIRRWIRIGCPARRRGMRGFEVSLDEAQKWLESKRGEAPTKSQASPVNATSEDRDAA